MKRSTCKWACLLLWALYTVIMLIDVFGSAGMISPVDVTGSNVWLAAYFVIVAMGDD